MFCLFDTKAINAKNSDMFKNTLRANKYVKQYLTLEVVKEMQIQNTIRYHHTSIKMENKMEKKKKKTRTSVGKDVEQSDHLCIVGGTVKWYNWYGKQYGGPLNN